MRLLLGSIVLFSVVGLIACNASSPTQPTGGAENDAASADLASAPVTGVTPPQLASAVVKTCGGVTSPGNPFGCCVYNGLSDGGNCTFYGWYIWKTTYNLSFPSVRSAKYWAIDARSAGYSVSSTCVANSLAVSTSGSDGHVAFVRGCSTTTVTVDEQNCKLTFGVRRKTYQSGFFDGGFILPAGPGTPSQIAWEFNSPGNPNGWSATNAYMTVAGGTLNADPGAGDYYFSGPSISATASTYRTVVVRMASNATDSVGKVYFRRLDSNYYSEDKTVTFTVSNCNLCGTAPYKEYQINMAANANWFGTITGLRLDPSLSGTAGTNRDAIGVDYLRLQ